MRDMIKKTERNRKGRGLQTRITGYLRILQLNALLRIAGSLSTLPCSLFGVSHNEKGPSEIDKLVICRQGSQIVCAFSNKMR